MALPIRRSDLVAGALLSLAALAGVALWPRLPAEIAVHFGAGGTPDNYTPKVVGVFLAPVIGVVTVAFVRVAVRADPTADHRVLAATVLFLGALVAYVQGLVLAFNLGYEYPMTAALAPVFVGTVGLVGYALAREGWLSGR